MRNCFSVLLLFSFSAATLAATPLQTDISVGYTYDDNVTRADLDSDIEKDSILNFDASARYKLPVNDMSYVSLQGTLDYNGYFEFEKLGNTRLGIHASYHLRPFAGYTATRYFVQATYEERLYESDQRDGSAVRLQLGLTKRLTDLVSIRAGYIQEDVDADEPQGVFDADNTRYYVDADLKTSSRNTVYASLGYTDGQVVSTTVPNAEIIAAACPQWCVRDDAFLDLVPDRVAYRLDAKTTAITIGDNYALASNRAVDASLFYYSSDAYGDIDYDGLIFNVNYLYRF